MSVANKLPIGDSKGFNREGNGERGWITLEIMTIRDGVVMKS
jgi:hypothetical protein